MKKLSLILVTLVTLSAFTFSTLWNQDKAHSELAFSVKHLGVSTVSGHFNDFDVVLKADKPDFSDAQIELTAKVNSINTRIEARDNHLKSADFFDAAKFPTLNFKSTAVKKGKKNTLIVTGDLTLHGVTKPVVLTLKYNGTTVNPMSNKETIGFDVTGSIKRSDFGVGTGFGEPVISDVVSIVASGEFSK